MPSQPFFRWPPTNVRPFHRTIPESGWRRLKSRSRSLKGRTSVEAPCRSMAELYTGGCVLPAGRPNFLSRKTVMLPMSFPQSSPLGRFAAGGPVSRSGRKGGLTPAPERCFAACRVQEVEIKIERKLELSSLAAEASDPQLNKGWMSYSSPRSRSARSRPLVGDLVHFKPNDVAIGTFRISAISSVGMRGHWRRPARN